MGKWVKNVDVRGLLDEYENRIDLDSLKELATKIANLLQSRLRKYIDVGENEWDPEFEELWERFKDHDFADVDEFNDLLNDMYDLFDSYRIWAGAA